MNKQQEKNEESKNKQNFGKTIIDDFRKGNFKRTLRQDLKDIYQFYLDRETRTRLASMGRFKRGMVMIFWFMKSLFLKLNPVRRILLLIAFWTFFLFNVTIGDNSLDFILNSKLLGFTIILLILALELKDKLLAHDELAVGRKVQMALMPEKNPKIAGWEVWLFTRPANEVGGDLVDYIHMKNDRLGLVIGDIAGKGLGAALFMSKLQASIRALAPTAKSLSELGSQMNDIFYRDGQPNRFATMLYLEINPRTNQIQFLNAGHNPPIILSNNKIRELDQGAPALGLMSTTNYAKQSITLNTGNVILFYSDGLTEARDTKDEFFGLQRLCELLKKNSKFSAEIIGNRLLTGVEQFIGDARPHDDLSMIVLKRIAP